MGGIEVDRDKKKRHGQVNYIFEIVTRKLLPFYCYHCCPTIFCNRFHRRKIVEMWTRKSHDGRACYRWIHWTSLLHPHNCYHEVAPDRWDRSLMCRSHGWCAAHKAPSDSSNLPSNRSPWRRDDSWCPPHSFLVECLHLCTDSKSDRTTLSIVLPAVEFLVFSPSESPATKKRKTRDM